MNANFNMIDCWAIICDKPKWIARVNNLENKGKKTTSAERSAKESTTTGSRPLGCKSSKQCAEKGCFCAEKKWIKKTRK